MAGGRLTTIGCGDQGLLLYSFIVFLGLPQKPRASMYNSLVRSRIFPPKAKNYDAKYELRIDAGEVVNGVKNIYLQINSEAKNEALKNYRAKHSSHANLAVGQIREDTPEEEQEKVVGNMLDEFGEQVKSNING